MDGCSGWCSGFLTSNWKVVDSDPILGFIVASLMLMKVDRLRCSKYGCETDVKYLFTLIFDFNI